MKAEEESPKGEAPEEPPQEHEAEADPSEEEVEPFDAEYEAARTVVERNEIVGNTIVVEGNFIGGTEGKRRTAVPVTDVTDHVDQIAQHFVKSSSYEPTVKALRDQGIALLVGSGCGNRVTASVALRQTEHDPLLELPGSLPPSDLVDAVKTVAKKGMGLLVDSIDTETLRSLIGFRLRHLRTALPDGAALVFTSKGEAGAAFPSEELPTIEGAPPDGAELVNALGQRAGLSPVALKRAEAALGLLPTVIAPTAAADLVALAEAEEDPERLASSIDGRFPALDDWLEQRPEARSVAALAAAATAHGLPSSDFERGAITLQGFLEDGTESPQEAARFSRKDHDWPVGLAACKPGYSSTYFGWQTTEVIEVCPPYQFDAVIRYLWSQLGGDFRQPFLRWLRDLPEGFGGKLAFAAARAAGILFAVDPVTIEQQLLRPWALDDHERVRNGTAIALGMPALVGADPGASRRLLQQWSNNQNQLLRRAAVAGYGGPLGIWDPSAAAVSRLWEVGWSESQLTDQANRAFAGLCAGGAEAERVRSTAIGLLAARIETVEATRVYEVLPLVFAQLAAGSRLARESLESLFSEGERAARLGLASVLGQAFVNREGRDSARACLGTLLRAVAEGRLSRAAMEQLIREMKVDAEQRNRLSALGSQLEQALKAEERSGRFKDVARSIHETFYDQGSGGGRLAIQQ